MSSAVRITSLTVKRVKDVSCAYRPIRELEHRDKIKRPFCSFTQRITEVHSILYVLVFKGKTVILVPNQGGDALSLCCVHQYFSHCNLSELEQGRVWRRGRQTCWERWRSASLRLEEKTV